MTLYTICLGVWFSGGLWLLLHYFFLQQGTFGPENSPLEPWCLKIHGALAFLTIWVFGLMWGIHIGRLWPLSNRRWSGGTTAGVFAFLIISGYLLYYVANDSARSIVSVLHWTVGLASPVVFFWHRISAFIRPTGTRTSKRLKHESGIQMAEELTDRK